MKNKKRMWLRDTYPLPLLKIFVYLILIATFCIFSIQIYDRYMFHEQIKEIAIKETKKRCNNAVKVTSDSVKKLSEKHMCKEFIEKNKQISIFNHIFNNSSDRNYDSDEVSLLDIMTKSDGLMSANGLTFCVTLIISLLATLVVIKLETNDKVIKETIEKEIASRYINTSKFNHLLARIESVYNLSIIIGNIAILLRQDGNEGENVIISTNIGNLCSRLSPICKEIDDRLTKRESRVNIISTEERKMLNMYLEDTLGELKRSLSFAEHINSSDLCIIIMKVIQDVEVIKDSIYAIELNSDHLFTL